MRNQKLKGLHKMKSVLKTISVMMLSILTSTAFSQKKQSFQEIELKDLRKTVLNQLIADNINIIDNKREKIFLSLRANETLLNGDVLANELHSKYLVLLEAYNIGRGTYRGIYIDNKCTAVGDFFKDSINGKIEGKFSFKNFTSSDI